jgi:hypothetical protein
MANNIYLSSLDKFFEQIVIFSGLKSERKVGDEIVLVFIDLL